MVTLSKFQNNYSNGVTTSIALDHTDSNNMQSERSIKITECFDLESIMGTINSNKAIADLKITVEQIPHETVDTKFTPDDEYMLKMDANGKPLQVFQTNHGAIAGIALTITIGSIAAFATAGVASPLILASVAGTTGIANALFSLMGKNKNTKPSFCKTVINNSKWYSYRRWLSKPCIMIQNLKLEGRPKDLQHNIPSSIVHYKLQINAVTGEKAGFLSRISEQDEIELNIHFQIMYT